MDSQVNLSHNISCQTDNPGQIVSKSGSTIYRLSLKGDRWGCKSCSKMYDKWGMIDHLCSKNSRKYLESLDIPTKHPAKQIRNTKETIHSKQTLLFSQFQTHSADDRETQQEK